MEIEVNNISAASLEITDDGGVYSLVHDGIVLRGPSGHPLKHSNPQLLDRVKSELTSYRWLRLSGDRIIEPQFVKVETAKHDIEQLGYATGELLDPQIVGISTFFDLQLRISNQDYPEKVYSFMARRGMIELLSIAPGPYGTGVRSTESSFQPLIKYVERIGIGFPKAKGPPAATSLTASLKLSGSAIKDHIKRLDDHE